MARIDVLPSIEIIRGLKGILDFYIWRGLPCVRAWPRYRPARQTDASLAAALTFGAIVKAYALLANLALQAYRQDALDQPRTARDIMVTGVFGNLHEASMSDFLDALIIIRDAVVALTDLLHALDSIDTDEIVVNVDQSVLPPLAATTTNQATAITALEKIDDLQNALESHHLDRLLVRGMNQLYTYEQDITRTQFTLNAAAPVTTLTFPGPPAGRVWKLTNLGGVDATNPFTRIMFIKARAAVEYDISGQLTVAADEYVSWAGEVWIKQNDTILIRFNGVTALDDLYTHLHAVQMTLET